METPASVWGAGSGSRSWLGGVVLNFLRGAWPLLVGGAVIGIVQLLGRRLWIHLGWVNRPLRRITKRQVAVLNNSVGAFLVVVCVGSLAWIVLTR